MPGDRARIVAALPIPGLRPVERSEQHQPQAAAVDAVAERQRDDQVDEEALVAVAQLDEARGHRRHVGGTHAHHDLRVPALLEQGLEVRDARGLEPLPRIGLVGDRRRTRSEIRRTPSAYTAVSRSSLVAKW